MTKALQLARSFHAAGHRVVLVESAKYRFTGHRFSRAVDAFHCVPEPSEPGYAEALLDVVAREQVDVFVPVSSPAASVPDAHARKLLDGVCDVVHGDPDTVEMLDDKASFAERAASLGLRVPDWRRITDPRQVADFDFPPGATYILKRVAYNPVGRMDLTPLSAATPERNAAFVASLPISADDPWILQEFVDGQEYCTHATVRDGRLQVYGCCESSACQVNYAHVDHPEIRRWVEHFVSALRLTGQVSFDFIECRRRGDPRHRVQSPHALARSPCSTTTRGWPTPISPTAIPSSPRATDARPTHWLYHELWRLLTQSDRRRRIAGVLRGTDAIFDWRDPLPYFMVHHLQIPSLLVDNLRRRRGWTRIDFNIGKLVENGGD